MNFPKPSMHTEPGEQGEEKQSSMSTKIEQKRFLAYGRKILFPKTILSNIFTHNSEYIHAVNSRLSLTSLTSFTSIERITYTVKRVRCNHTLPAIETRVLVTDSRICTKIRIKTYFQCPCLSLRKYFHKR